MRETLCTQLALTPEFCPEIQIKIGNSTHYIVNKKVTCDITLESVTKQHQLYIYEHLPYPCVLSVKFLSEFYLNIRACPDGIKVTSEPCEFMIIEAIPVKLHSKYAFDIAPCTGAMVPIVVDTDDGPIEIKSNTVDRIMIPSGIYIVTDKETEIQVQNPSSALYHIHRNKVLAVINTDEHSVYEE